LSLRHFSEFFVHIYNSITDNQLQDKSDKWEWEEMNIGAENFCSKSQKRKRDDEVNTVAKRRRTGGKQILTDF